MNTPSEIYIFESPHYLANFYAKLWTQIAVDAICLSGRFTAALSGGRTSIEFFSKLSNVDTYELWRNTYIFQVDERFVSDENDDNNMTMIRDNLLDYVNIPKKNVFPIYTDLDNAKSAAFKYQKSLQEFFGGQDAPVFDLISLGVGTDGHTASLFPGSEALHEVTQWVIPVSSAQIPNDRITLTYPVINRARHIVFQIQGKDKASVVRRLCDGDKTLPATSVHPEAGRLIYLLDKDAAKELTYGDDYTNVGEGILINQ